MICHHKPDPHTLRHLSFNQSPSPLAAGHTTRQDLNGMCNLREHVGSGQDADGSGGGGGGGLVGQGGTGGEGANLWPTHPEPHAGSGNDTGRLSREAGLPSCSKAVEGGEGHYRPSAQLPPSSSSSSPSSRWSRVWSWAAWVLSVLVVSWIFSSWRLPWSSSSSPPPSVLRPSSSPTVPSPSPIRKRASTCGSNNVDKAAYNTPLHIAAVFIILVISTLACAFPIIAKRAPGLRIPGRFFFAVRHVGTGVLIATAFVHLLPTAFISLGDPCLGSFWTDDYPAMPGAIALAAIFLVTVVEMVFHPSRHVPPVPMFTPEHGHGGQRQDGEDREGNAGALVPPSHSCMGSANVVPLRDMGPLRGRATSIGQGLTRLHTTTEDDENEPTAAAAAERTLRRKESTDDAEPGVEHLPVVLSAEQRQRKELLQCVLLELGILFHSVFIGMALSVSIGNEFIILLIAIVFHQTFEGLALGSRIAAIKWPQDKMQPWLMALAYGCTTPIGQAIGLATHTLYSPDSEVGLIVVGVMNAISAGLLTFASLVELLSEDFLSDESWRFLYGKKRVAACFLVFLGAFCMSLVGAWA